MRNICFLKKLKDLQVPVAFPVVHWSPTAVILDVNPCTIMQKDCGHSGIVGKNRKVKWRLPCCTLLIDIGATTNEGFRIAQMASSYGLM